MTNIITFVIKIQVSNSSHLADAEYLKAQEEGLKWLLGKHLGEKSSLTASDFKTLPEGADVVETYENNELKGRAKEIAAGLNEESNPVVLLYKYKSVD